MKRLIGTSLGRLLIDLIILRLAYPAARRVVEVAILLGQRLLGRFGL